MLDYLIAIITVYEGLILLRAVLSWFVSPNSTHPVIQIIKKLTDPVLEPVRKQLPVSSGIDFSPLIVLVALELLKRVLA